MFETSMDLDVNFLHPMQMGTPRKNLNWKLVSCFVHIFRGHWVNRKVALKLCLVLLCDQNSVGQSKMVLVWPNWFASDHNDLVITKMNWSGPNWNYDISIKPIWTQPNHFGCDQFILVITKSLWSGPYQFGQTKTVLVT